MGWLEKRHCTGYTRARAIKVRASWDQKSANIQLIFSSLSRPVYPMPEFAREALAATGLMEAYRSRPPYPQIDYIG